MLKTIPQLIAEIRTKVRCLPAREALQEARENSGLVIDVREPDEVAASPVAGSVNIPRGVLEMKMSALSPDPDTPIYIHCATGARAALSAEQLQRIGYRRVTAISCPLETLCNLCGEG